MTVVGLGDPTWDARQFFGPFDDIDAARAWLEEHHSDTYEIRGDYEFIRIRDPKLGELA